MRNQIKIKKFIFQIFATITMKIAAINITITPQFIENLFSTAAAYNAKKQINSRIRQTKTKKLAKVVESIVNLRRKQIYLNKSYCYRLI